MNWLSKIVRPTRQNALVIASRNGRLGDAEIKGGQVQIWRPPVMLNAEGTSMPGISKEMIANYLVSTTAALAKTDLGPISVEWVEQQGRFATTQLTVHAWDQQLTVLHPVAPISQAMQNALLHYQSGIITKVQELHKGHQNFRSANERIQRAIREVDQLRDAPTPQFNDVEYMFVRTTLSDAFTLSALVPAPNEPGENLFPDDKEDFTGISTF